MKEKTLFEVLQESLNGYESSLMSTFAGRPVRQKKRQKPVFLEKTIDAINTAKRYLKARRIAGSSASWDDISFTEMELRDEEEEKKRSTAERENYYRHIAIGLLDMNEAIVWRHVIFANQELTNDAEEIIVNLFNTGKRTLLMYSRWLSLSGKDDYIKKWIDTFDPIHYDTINSFDSWVDTVSTLPMD